MGNNIGQPSDLDSMRKYAGMTSKHVLILKERLEMLSDAELSITKDSFSLAMKTKEIETDRIFRIFDLSSINKIETLEFVCALSLLSYANLKEKCDLIFGLYDFDKNRTMNKQELIILIKTVLTTINAISSKGECTIQEAMGYANTILDRYDTNGDASISMKEFYSFVSKDPDILKILLSYGLISLEDLRFNFGEVNPEFPIPDADSDLEDEIYKSRQVISEEEELINLGIGKDEEVQVVEQKWMRQIKDYEQPDFEMQDADVKPPNATLEMSYVYGMRCSDTRNNLKYSMENELVYHQGAIGITLNKEGEQKFFLEHTDDITCLDLQDNYVATGQMGRVPSILVWDVRTMESKAVFRGVLRVGVSNLALSNDARKLAAIGMDEDQCVVIYDIDKAFQSRITGKRDDSLIASAKGPVKEIFDIKFDKSDKTIIIACMGEVNFITFDNNLIKNIKGVWDPKYCQLQAILSIGVLENAVAVGTFKGQLLQWRGSRSTHAVEAHKGPVMSIHSQKKVMGIISGGRDGMLCFWDYNLKLQKAINIQQVSPVPLLNQKIMAVCESNDGLKIAISTRGGQLIEITGNKCVLRMSGHYNGKLVALATHPSQQYFYTSGEDQMLMSWNADLKELLKSVKLDYQCNSIDVCEKYLVGGCNNGNILIMDPMTLGLLSEFKDRDSGITCVKLSPDLEYFIVYYQSPYNEFFIYSPKQKFKKISSILCGQGKCQSIDFAPSKRVQIAFQNELLFMNLSIEPPQIYRNYQYESWSTHNSIYGWPVKGIWNTDGIEVSAVDVNSMKNVIAVVDYYASIKLYRYPAYDNQASFYRYCGHSSEITGVKFTAKDEYLISVGGKEKSIIQWKFNIEQDVQERTTNKIKQQQQTQQDQYSDDDNNNDNKKSINKPFKDIMKFEDSQITQIPQQYLNIKYIFGISTQVNEQNIYNLIKYSSNSKLVFFVGCVGVVQNTKIDQSASFRKQKYYQHHNQQIISIAMHPKGSIVATGTNQNQIYLWDVETKQTLVKIIDFHKKGISKLKFSIEGTLLLSIGLDMHNSLAIHDWQANRLICTSKIDSNPIADMCFIVSQNSISFATCGDFLRIWTLKGRNLAFDQYSGAQTAIAYAFNSEIVTGNKDGYLILWRNKNYLQREAHRGRVNILLAQKQNLYSAGQDGKIMLWHLQQNQLTNNSQILLDGSDSILGLDVKNEIVIYVDIRGDVKELVTIGQSRQNDILKFSTQEVYGLATNKFRFITCGLDKYLRLWEVKNRVMLQQQEFKVGLRCCDWASNGFIIVGDVKCFLYLMNEKFDNLHTVQTKFKTNQYQLSALKFSPDGMRIACGATGGPSAMEVWTIVQSRLEKQIIISIGFTSGMCHLDWSQDAHYIVASSESYELKCVSLQKQRDVQFNYDIKWHSWSCQYGPIVQEIYPKTFGEDVTAVQVNTDYLLSGDKFGNLSLFHCPAYSRLRREYQLFMGPIQQIRFIQDTYVVSIGNRIISIHEIKQDEQVELSEEMEKLVQQHISIPQVIQKKVGLEKFGKKNETEMQDINDQEMEQVDIEFSKTIFTKPWATNIKEPSQYYKDPINQTSPPLIDLEIEHAFGYRGNDCKNNLKYLKNGSILYHTASLGIVLDISLNEQKIFDQHKDDIIALDLHPDGIRVATGDLNDAIIYIWDSNTLQALCKFTNLTVGIRSLNFSPNGDMLVASGMDSQNSISIYDINTKSQYGGSVILHHATSQSQIYEVKWFNNFKFYSIGPYHFKYWTLATPIECHNIEQENILYTFLIYDELIYIADHQGQLLIYDQTSTLQHTITYHTQQIEAIYANNSFLITGSKDQFIYIFQRKNIRSEPLLTIKLTDYLKTAFSPQIKSVYLHNTEPSILIGTFGCEIWELNTKDTKITNVTKFTHKIVMKAHYAPNQKSELWGLAIDGDFIYTCGDDATLRQFSIQQKKQIALVKTTQDQNYSEIKPDENGIYPDSVKGRSIAISPDSVVVGFKDGGMRVYDRDNKQRAYLKVAKEWISDIKFNSNFDMLAIGSHDNSIYLYNYPELTPYLKPLRKHSNFIKNIDFSVDGTKIISTCGDYDLIYWDVKTGKQMPSGRIQLRDEVWNTFTNTLGWPVQGIWKDGYQGTEINCVSRSHKTFASKSPDNYYLLAVGNDFNQIQIYRYPCVNRVSEPLIRIGHSSPIAQVKFNSDDTYLVTLGGEDMTIILWRVIKKL